MRGVCWIGESCVRSVRGVCAIGESFVRSVRVVDLRASIFVEFRYFCVSMMRDFIIIIIYIES